MSLPRRGPGASGASVYSGRGRRQRGGVRVEAKLHLPQLHHRHQAGGGGGRAGQAQPSCCRTLAAPAISLLSYLITACPTLPYLCPALFCSLFCLLLLSLPDYSCCLPPANCTSTPPPSTPLSILPSYCLHADTRWKDLGPSKEDCAIKYCIRWGQYNMPDKPGRFQLLHIRSNTSTALVPTGSRAQQMHNGHGQRVTDTSPNSGQQHSRCTTPCPAPS